MYIDFLNESPLWYWYHSGGVIAGLVVTVILGAIVFGQSNWKTGGILLKTMSGQSLMEREFVWCLMKGPEKGVITEGFLPISK